MDSLQEYYAEMLARFGGFSHKAIAAKINGMRQDRVPYDNVKEVTNLLRRRKVRVMDWRNMKSEEAQAASEKITKSTKRRKKKAG